MQNKLCLSVCLFLSNNVKTAEPMRSKYMTPEKVYGTSKLKEKILKNIFFYLKRRNNSKTYS